MRGDVGMKRREGPVLNSFKKGRSINIMERKERDLQHEKIVQQYCCAARQEESIDQFNTVQ